MISNFKITGDVEYAGLFGYSKGTIQNLGLENFTIDVSRSVTIYAGGLVGYNSGSITNCYAAGDVSATASGKYVTAYTGAYAYAYAGGLVGYNYGTIMNSYATGSVSATASSTSTSYYDNANAYAGGLVGYNYGSNAAITNCYAMGDVSTSTSSYDDAYARAGGLVGLNSGTITHCYATGDVSASSTSSSAYVGGLIGENYESNAAITNCYRYSGQIFTVTKNGKIRYSATNAEGAATSIENLQSEAWVEENLWKAEIEIWSFGSGYPTLDYEVIDALMQSEIEISTKEEIMALQGCGLIGNYKLMADIDLGGMEWQPIAIFVGTFEGNGHVIENFKITGDVQYAGLFGRNYGTIQNLGTENFTIDVSRSGSAYAGGLVGYNGSSATIMNSYATGDVSASSTNSSARAGGLVGYNESSATIMNSYATGDVSASSTRSYSAYAGGLVGRNDGTITNSYATGDVSASDTSSYSYAYAGGLVGYNGSNGTITNCYRYSGQSLTVAVNGTTTNEATNTDGDVADMATLQSVDFQQNTLLWSAEDWNFAEGAHPTLKNVGPAN